MPIFVEEFFHNRLMKAGEDFLNRKMRAANNAVGCAVINGHGVAVHQVAIGKDDLAGETGAFVIRHWLYDRFTGTREHLQWLLQIQENRSEAITVLAVGTVI